MKIRYQFITDTIEKYIKDYPEEYKIFLGGIKERRKQMHDSSLGKLRGAEEIRNAVSMPERLYHAIMYVLNGVDEQAFLEDKKEMKWFVTKFKQFVIPNKY